MLCPPHSGSAGPRGQAEPEAHANKDLPQPGRRHLTVQPEIRNLANVHTAATKSVHEIFLPSAKVRPV